MNLQTLIQDAFQEDMPTGDLTTDSLQLPPIQGRARLIAKEDLVLSGIECFEKSIHYVESQAKFKWQFKEGDFVYHKLSGPRMMVIAVGKWKSDANDEYAVCQWFTKQDELQNAYIDPEYLTKILPTEE